MSRFFLRLMSAFLQIILIAECDVAQLPRTNNVSVRWNQIQLGTHPLVGTYPTIKSNGWVRISI